MHSDLDVKSIGDLILSKRKDKVQRQSAKTNKQNKQTNKTTNTNLNIALFANKYIAISLLYYKN